MIRPPKAAQLQAEREALVARFERAADVLTDVKALAAQINQTLVRDLKGACAVGVPSSVTLDQLAIFRRLLDADSHDVARGLAYARRKVR